jgi:hypothetical protein
VTGRVGAQKLRQAIATEKAMAGHSQFKNIMHRKGRQDAVKSKLFGKLAREITVAAKLGLPDPTMNARLRAAVIAARAENMTKDSIERAIKKAQGGDGEAYDEIRYECVPLSRSMAATWPRPARYRSCSIMSA